MFEKAAPFKQLIFLIKLFGLQPNLISRRHKIIALLIFIPFEFIYGSLMILSVKKIKENPELAFQLPFVMAVWIKMVHYFRSFEKMEKFKENMSELFENTNENFQKAFKASRILSLVYFAPFVLLGVFATTFSWFANLKVLLFWKPPIEMSENIWFVLHWIEESVGIHYSIVISSAMDLYPFCIMILLQDFFNKLNQRIKKIKTKEEFKNCVETHKKLKVLIQDFQECFSPLIFIHAFMMLLLFCATLLILTSKQNLETFRVVSFIIFGFNSIGQLLMLAYFGHLIESASDDMSTAFYEHDWIDCDKEHKKNLVLMMINANYTMKLRAGEIFDVNLPNFLFIIKTSYSLCNVLRSLK